MTKFYDPLARFRKNSVEMTTENYLSLRIKNFKNLPDKSAQFYEAIDKLVEIQYILKISNSAGANQSNNLFFPSSQENFIKTINWLKFGNNFSIQYNISSINSYNEIDENTSQYFLININSIYTTLINDQNCKNLKLFESLIANKDFPKIKENSDNLNNELDENAQNLKQNLDEYKNEKSAELQEQNDQNLKNSKDEISKFSEEYLAKIKTAQVLEIWDKNYKGQIQNCEEKLYGNKEYLKQDEKQKHKLKNFKKWIFNHTIPFAPRRFWLLIILGGLSAVIAFFVIIPEINNFTEILKNSQEHSNFSSSLIIAKIIAYLGFLLIPTIAYSSANKNYRVYLNQLDEYKQRAVIAQTLQGMMSYIDNDEQGKNKDIRANIASIAASSMFAIRNTGHLSKRGDESGIFDFASSLISKKQS